MDDNSVVRTIMSDSDHLDLDYLIDHLQSIRDQLGSCTVSIEERPAGYNTVTILIAMKK